MEAQKMNKKSVLVSVPEELLPDIVDLVTAAFMRQQNEVVKKDRIISELQYELSEQKNVIEAIKQKAENDNF